MTGRSVPRGVQAGGSAATAFRPLGRLAPRRFLREHWQRRPLVVRGAWPAPLAPVGRDELAGLACESGIESRLVWERDGQWSVESGPFMARKLRALPRERWVLLVQDVDKLVDGVAALLDPFAFLPRWRLDDVMISFSPAGASVGPHVDSYDVFLLQVQGRKRWQVASHFDRAALRPGSDLAILDRFEAEAEWVLSPGDLLYLPPRVAHHGVALDDSLTYSIGLRAQHQQELVQSAVGALESEARRDWLYADPERAPVRHVAELEAAALSRLRDLLRAGLVRDDAWLDGVVGRALTEPKPHFQPSAPRPLTLERFQARAARRALRPAVGARLAFIAGGGRLRVFAGGSELECEDRPALRRLLDGLARGEAQLPAAAARRTASAWRLLHRLYGLGWVSFGTG